MNTANYLDGRYNVAPPLALSKKHVELIDLEFCSGSRVWNRQRQRAFGLFYRCHICYQDDAEDCVVASACGGTVE